MKRLLSIVLLLALLLTGCGSKGAVGGAVMDIGPSQMFGEGEIKAAMKVVVNSFVDEMGGCTLQELSYREELNQKQGEEWARQYHVDEAIVIGSVFHVHGEDGPVTLEPGSTHTWSWVLTRNEGEGWTLRTWGYA